MPVPVPQLPPQGVSTSLVVGTPASATIAAMLAQCAAFLHGRTTAPVCTVGQLASALNGAGDVFVAYQRRPGVESLRVVAELRLGANPGSTGEIEVTLHSGTGTIGPWHVGAASVDLDGGMDGTRDLPATSRVLADYMRFEGFLDVSDLTVGTLALLKFSVDAAGTARGFASLHVSEVPVPTHDPVADPTYEPGVDAAWTQSGNAIIDGDASSPRGVGRILHALDSVRLYCPLHWQLPRQTDRPLAPDYAALTAFVEHLRTRAPAVRGTTNPCPVRFGLVYRFSPTYAGLANSYVRMTAVGISGSTETTDLPLTDTAAAWFYDEVNGEWPCDGTAQEIELSFSARTESDNGGGGTAHDPVEIALIVVLGRAP